jgi:hypothetical protein
MLEKEFEKLCARYEIKYLRLHFDEKLLGELDSMAAFNFLLWEIILDKNFICRKRLISLIHEMRHATQYQQGQMRSKDKKYLYALEVEAEMFARAEYEELYSERYGSCDNDPWSLASYDKYSKHFDLYRPLYWGSKR